MYLYTTRAPCRTILHLSCQLHRLPKDPKPQSRSWTRLTTKLQARSSTAMWFLPPQIHSSTLSTQRRVNFPSTPQDPLRLSKTDCNLIMLLWLQAQTVNQQISTCNRLDVFAQSPNGACLVCSALRMSKVCKVACSSGRPAYKSLLRPETSYKIAVVAIVPVVVELLSHQFMWRIWKLLMMEAFLYSSPISLDLSTI